MPAPSLRKTLVLLAALLVLIGAAALLEGPWRPFAGQDRGPRMLSAPPGEVSRLQIDGGGGSVVLRREGEGWKAGHGGPERAADMEAVNRVLEWLAGLDDGAVVSRKAGHHAEFRVDEEGGVKLAAFAGERTAADLIVGAPGPDLFSSYVRAAGRDEVRLVKGQIRPLLDRPPGSWWDLTLLAFDPAGVTALEAAPAGRPLLRFERREGKWYSAGGGGGESDARAAELVERLASLRAAAVAEEQPPDGAFARPRLVLTLVSDAGERRTLEVGDEVPGRNRLHARVTGDDAVFELGAFVVEELERALGEPKPAAQER